MSRIYLIAGQQVTVSWISRQHPAVYTIRIAGTPATGSVEKTAGGSSMLVMIEAVLWESSRGFAPQWSRWSMRSNAEADAASCAVVPTAQ